MIEGALESLLAPADVLRRQTLLLIGPWAATWARQREMRVAVLGAIAVVASFLGAALAPLWMLALGPILLGVPHLLGDVRYLWVRPGFHRRALCWLTGGVPLLVGVLTARVVWGLLGAAAALLIARTSWRRRCLGLAILVPLGALSVHYSGWAELLFAHLHNVIGIALWWAWRPRAGRLHWVPLGLFLLASAGLLAGMAAPLLAWSGGLSAPGSGTSMSYHMASLAPHAGRELGLRLVLLFAFAQSLHYAVWLRLIPEEDRPRAAPRTFVGTFRALRDEFGVWLLCAVGALALGLAVWACVDLGAARTGYLRFAGFHGQLELVAAALLWAEGHFGSRRPPTERTSG
ncbi:uncharacterized protein CMC5_075810 [Chondromyces crocatus]|uniref:Beta-carotene 15,15'-dioxygenase n=1 Tax=Chondromyces crocatus TaxID=52 RepID=A0A0K1ER97_CHOCO|nr:uncharacterized protein CMC5_075810 [Chondromyces crocatus]